MEGTLLLNGIIIERNWFDGDIASRLFRGELLVGSGDITIWINSPGSDCVTTAQIYNMMIEYPGNVTVKIDGIAASAASVIAMADAKVLVSPVSVLVIHNPMTATMGDISEIQKTIAMLAEVKELIISAYEIRTGMSHAKLSHPMNTEAWTDARAAIDMGFTDGVLAEPAKTPVENNVTDPMLFPRAAVTNSLMDKLATKCRVRKPETPERSVNSLMERLDLIRQYT